jgi:hypothetical protein
LRLGTLVLFVFLSPTFFAQHALAQLSGEALLEMLNESTFQSFVILTTEQRVLLKDLRKVFGDATIRNVGFTRVFESETPDASWVLVMGVLPTRLMIHRFRPCFLITHSAGGRAF